MPVSRLNQDAGASPLFPPQYPEQESAKEAILHTVRRDPRAFGIECTRWTLAAIHQVCDWLRTNTLPGLHQILDRLEIVWKRGREHVHSPDPDYPAKLALVKELTSQARSSQGKIVLLYQDEFSFYRQPTLAYGYEERGHHQPLAERSYQYNTRTRLTATLDAVTGRVLFYRTSYLGIDQLRKFYQQIVLAYSAAERIYLVQDNWPIHVHPDVLVALEKQEGHWPYHRPAKWPTEPTAMAIAKCGDWELPIQLVFLPTYASWTNPIEKLWRKLKAEVLHLHRLADKLEELRQLVDDSLNQYANGSLELLRYVGLLHPS